MANDKTVNGRAIEMGRGHFNGGFTLNVGDEKV